MCIRTMAGAGWIVVALWSFPGQPAARQDRERSPERVEPRVLDEQAESADGRADVVVALREPAGSAFFALERHTDAVAQVQQRVLDALAPAELELRHRYFTFAGLTGRASSAGIARLASLPAGGLYPIAPPPVAIGF